MSENFQVLNMRYILLYFQSIFTKLIKDKNEFLKVLNILILIKYHAA